MEKKINPVVTTALDAWADQGKRSTVRITGNSMWPLIRNGSSVVVEHGTKGMHFGDIILYRREENLIAHRIVRVIRRNGKRQYITKGDRWFRYDPKPFDEKQIVGKVVGVVKGEKFITLQTKYWDIVGSLLGLFSYLFGLVGTRIKRSS